MLSEIGYIKAAVDKGNSFGTVFYGLSNFCNDKESYQLFQNFIKGTLSTIIHKIFETNPGFHVK